jgi:hypothetical protein
MDERKAGRMVGELLADLVYFSCILGMGVLSVSLLSKLIKVIITREVMRNVNKHNHANDQDYPESDLE